MSLALRLGVRNATLVVVASLALCFLTACPTVDSPGSQRSEPAATTDGSVAGESTSHQLEARSEALLAAMRDRNAEAIAGFIHPVQGVRFSPYAFVDPAEDQVLTVPEFLEGWRSDAPHLWGVEDGTGEPLTMSCADYFGRFVYDADFLEAERVTVGWSTERRSIGNTIDNAREVYPEGTCIEYHFSGFDPKYEGMDWKSLRLVFEQFEGQWYVVAIIHDGWTT